MAKDKKEELAPVPVKEDKPKQNPLELGMVEIELLRHHGTCTPGKTRIMKRDQANVLVNTDPPTAKIIRE